MEPGFAHHGADALPVIEDEGKRLRLIAGSLYGERAPVEVFSEMFYADATLSGTARLDLPAEHEERAAWVAEGRIEVGGDVFDAGQMLVFRPGEAVAIKALDPARLILFGGEAMDAAACLVEFRVELDGAHRTGQGRLEGWTLWECAGRRDRVHSAAGGVAFGRSIRSMPAAPWRP